MVARLCSYIVRCDKGFAPNPFWGYCTLTVCTPNHQGICLNVGDWIVGFSSKSHDNKLIYAMEVSEVLSFDAYYQDQRFQKKKPQPVGSWRERCGDNMYFRDVNGHWQQLDSPYHGPEFLEKDTKHAQAFISHRGKFYYFGENAIGVPTGFSGLIPKRQGCWCNHTPETVQSFLNWLKRDFTSGSHGNPRDILWNESCLRPSPLQNVRKQNCN